MITIILDPHELAYDTMGDINGRRCAVGHILWAFGVPHDVLLGKGTLESLDQQYLEMAGFNQRSIFAGEIINTIYEQSDSLVREMRACRTDDQLGPIRDLAYDLISLGREIGVQFVIASLMKQVDSRQRRAAKTQGAMACRS